MDTTNRRSLRILLVEDDADTADSMAMVLRLHGYDVEVAGDGSTVLQRADDDPPDVVLLNIELPKMNGWQVAKALRQRRAKPRPLLIAVSGYGHKAARLRSYEAGIDLHLVKPVDPREVVHLLRRFQRIVLAGARSTSPSTPAEPPPRQQP